LHKHHSQGIDGAGLPQQESTAPLLPLGADGSQFSDRPNKLSFPQT